MSGLVPQGPCEVRLPEGTLAQKLSLCGAMIQAVREAHRDDMSATSWAALNIVEEKIAEAILRQNERRLIGQ